MSTPDKIVRATSHLAPMKPFHHPRARFTIDRIANLAGKEAAQ
jgi:hypothetical protein